MSPKTCVCVYFLFSSTSPEGFREEDMLKKGLRAFMGVVEGLRSLLPYARVLAGKDMAPKDVIYLSDMFREIGLRGVVFPLLVHHSSPAKVGKAVEKYIKDLPEPFIPSPYVCHVGGFRYITHAESCRFAFRFAVPHGPGSWN